MKRHERYTLRLPHYYLSECEILLLVDDSGDIPGFLELLTLIYNKPVRVSHKDQAQFWVRIEREPQHTLAGVRVAARVCNVTFENIRTIN